VNVISVHPCILTRSREQLVQLANFGSGSLGLPSETTARRTGRCTIAYNAALQSGNGRSGCCGLQGCTGQSSPVRTLPIVAAEAALWRNTSTAYREMKTGVPLQHCPHPVDPRHPPASQGARPRTLADPLGTHSVMGKRCVRPSGVVTSRSATCNPTTTRAAPFSYFGFRDCAFRTRRIILSRPTLYL